MEERAANISKEMTLLKLLSTDGRELGMINWLGVHPTSIGPANHLIGGDHKGLAEYWFEKSKNADFKSAKPFVAAFALAPRSLPAGTSSGFGGCRMGER